MNKVTKMKPNMCDVPYTVEKNKLSSWVITLLYAKLDSFMPLAQEQLVISREPLQDRWSLFDNSHGSQGLTLPALKAEQFPVACHHSLWCVSKLSM